jgi:hypothetical protein
VAFRADLIEASQRHRPQHEGTHRTALPHHHRPDPHQRAPESDAPDATGKQHAISHLTSPMVTAGTDSR